METSFNVFDLIFFTFTFIFVISAFFRGIIKEIFSILNWIFSFLVAYFLAPFASNILEKYFSNLILLESLTRSVIFIICFITIALTTRDLRNSVSERIPAMFDKSLGVLFGFAKTLIVFGAIYSIYFNIQNLIFHEKVKDPKWLKSSKSYGIIKLSASILNPPIEKFISEISPNLNELDKLDKEKLDKKIEEIFEKKAEIEKNIDLKDVKKDAGYSKKDIEKMKHLIEIIDE